MDRIGHGMPGLNPSKRSLQKAQYIKSLSANRSNTTSTLPSVNHIDVLPPDVILKIMAKLSHTDKLRARYTCKSWFDICKTPVLWKSINFRDHGNNDQDNDYLDPRRLKEVAGYAGAELEEIDFHGHPVTKPGVWEGEFMSMMNTLPMFPQLKCVCVPLTDHDERFPNYLYCLLRAAVRSCDHLTTLKFTGTDDFNHVFADIISSKKVTVLNMNFEYLSPAPQIFVVNLHQNFPNLQELYIDALAPQSMCDQACASLPMTLRKIFFAWGPPMTLKGAKALAQKPSLKSVGIRFGKRSDEGDIVDETDVSDLFTILSNNLQLHDLVLLNSKGLTEESIMDVIKSQPSLESLAILRIRINTPFLRKVGRYLPAIKSFSLASWKAAGGYSAKAMCAFVKKTSTTLETVKFYSPVGNAVVTKLRERFPSVSVTQQPKLPTLPWNINQLWK